MNRRRTSWKSIVPDADLWEHVRRTIDPLREGTGPEDPPPGEGRVEISLPEKERIKRRAPYPSEMEKPKTPPPGDLTRREKRRLKKGRAAIEASLDLHGLSRDGAYDLLARKIPEYRARGLSTIIIVTGTGRQGGGVLRTLVPQWLRGTALAAHIRSFSAAGPRHGREGALYVQLKRKRTERR